MTKIFLLFIIAFIPLVFSVSSKEQNVKENNHEVNNFIKAQNSVIIGKERKLRKNKTLERKRKLKKKLKAKKEKKAKNLACKGGKCMKRRKDKKSGKGCKNGKCKKKLPRKGRNMDSCFSKLYNYAAKLKKARNIQNQVARIVANKKQISKKKEKVSYQRTHVNTLITWLIIEWCF